MNPFATLENLRLEASTADDPKEIVRSPLNPIAQAGYNALVGPPAFSPAGTSRLGYVARAEVILQPSLPNYPNQP